ncbi:MAG: cytoplasmic protein [Proteobacteria bacterium]|nr:cytoplasmic protein [Pseudomonadota bacterium]MBU4010738.1 cytoplasmic protein [Pseudomonadota bacterium]
MIKDSFSLRHPLERLVGSETEIIQDGGFGAILAYAGVGKTALLIQLAIYNLLSNNNVLHISLNDAVKKVGLWYKEVYRNIAFQHSIEDQEQLFETLLPHRFIMTFEVDGFSVPKLEERLTELMEQNIFRPHIVLIDGLPFDVSQKESLIELKAFAQRHSLKLWFTVRIQRDETPLGIPAHFNDIEYLFEKTILIQPEGKDIQLKALKGGKTDSEETELFIDPTTMLIKENKWIQHIT